MQNKNIIGSLLWVGLVFIVGILFYVLQLSYVKNRHISTYFRQLHEYLENNHQVAKMGTEGFFNCEEESNVEKTIHPFSLIAVAIVGDTIIVEGAKLDDLVWEKNIAKGHVYQLFIIGNIRENTIYYVYDDQKQIINKGTIDCDGFLSSCLMSELKGREVGVIFGETSRYGNESALLHYIEKQYQPTAHFNPTYLPISFTPLSCQDLIPNLKYQTTKDCREWVY